MTTDPATLARLAACYCFDRSRWKPVEILLLARWANVSPGPPSDFTWSPPSALVNWTDGSGSHGGNLAVFMADGDPATVVELDSNGTGITSIDGLSSLPLLQQLFVNLNNLTSLDVSGNTHLTELQCANNSLSSLVLTGAVNLSSLDCSNNLLTALDISGMPMSNLTCDSNQLPTSVINQILFDLSINGITGGTVTCDTQSPLAPPSIGPPNGIAAAAALSSEVPPWGVTTD